MTRKVIVIIGIIIVIVLLYLSRFDKESNFTLGRRIDGLYQAVNFDNLDDTIFSGITFDIKPNCQFTFSKKLSSLVDWSGKWRIEGTVPYQSLELYFDNNVHIQIDGCDTLGCVIFIKFPSNPEDEFYNDYIPFKKIKQYN